MLSKRVVSMSRILVTTTLFYATSQIVSNSYADEAWERAKRSTKESYERFYNKHLNKSREEGTDTAGKILDKIYGTKGLIRKGINALDKKLDRDGYYEENKRKVEENREKNKEEIKKGFLHWKNKK